MGLRDGEGSQEDQDEGRAGNEEAGVCARFWNWLGTGRILFGVWLAARASFCLREIPPILIARGQGDGIQGRHLGNAGKLSIEETLDG